MTPARRRTFFFSVLASLVFWLGVDWVSRLPLLDPQEGFLAPIPGWKRLLLVAVVASVFYVTARLIAAASPKRWVRRALWVAASVVLIGGARMWLEAVAEAYSPFDPERAHMPLRFERPTLAGTAWWNVVGGDCGVSVSRDVLVFETEARVRREMRHLNWDGYTTVIHGLLGVWPHGMYTDTGTVRDNVIYWEDDAYPERIERVDGGLRVTGAPELMDDR